MTTKGYRGRLAPSPTGYLHLGHAYTFWTAQQRAEQRNGSLTLRIEDLDQQRCKESFVEALVQDLNWLGINWHEGFSQIGKHGPYTQSQRLPLYQKAFEDLRARDLVYPCRCTRQDVLRALSAPHDGNEEPIYPGTCRTSQPRDLHKVNWRFRAPLDTNVQFTDGFFSEQSYTIGKHFGDFVVWRQDNWPSYQLAVVVDDAAMEVTEVVRGKDLLLSTARQILLYNALGLPIPEFYHTPIIRDETGARLSKRHDAVAIRALKQQGFTAAELRSWWQRDREVVPSARVLQT